MFGHPVKRREQAGPGWRNRRGPRFSLPSAAAAARQLGSRGAASKLNIFSRAYPAALGGRFYELEAPQAGKGGGKGTGDQLRAAAQRGSVFLGSCGAGAAARANAILSLDLSLELNGQAIAAAIVGF